MSSYNFHIVESDEIDLEDNDKLLINDMIKRSLNDVKDNCLYKKRHAQIYPSGLVGKYQHLTRVLEFS
jgi:hypothetical protein